MNVRYTLTTTDNAEARTETTVMEGCTMINHPLHRRRASKSIASKAHPSAKATRLLRMVNHKQEARNLHMARLLILASSSPQ